MIKPNFTVRTIFLVLFSILIASTIYAVDRKLIVVGESYPPFEFIQDGQVVGIDIDIASALFKKMGIPVEFEIKPWRRAWANVEKGKVDAILSTSRKDSRKPYLIYPEEDMWVSEFVFFARKDDLQKEFTGYETAVSKKFKIGIVSGNSYDSAFWKAFPYQNGATQFQGDLSGAKLNEQLDSVSRFEINLRKLEKGRIDLTIADRVVGSYTAKLMGLQDKISYHRDPLYSKGYPMPFVKNSTYPELEKIAVQYEKELKAFKKTADYQAIFDKWLK